MLAALRHTAAWRAARGVKRAARPPRTDAALSAADCRGTVELVDPPVAVDPGRHVPWRVRLTNRGGAAWAAAGADPVRLGFRWLTFDGLPFGPPAAFPLPAPAYPGEPVAFAVPFAAPGHVGDFVLEVGLTQPAAGPFAARQPDAAPARLAVHVTGRRADDIDYHAVYRTADLDRNHWWVVGAYHTEADYKRSQAERRHMLAAHAGLTPDSRVLDVGCGTGQLAAALADFLSDRGAYYGTDIGAEAVDFCRRTHRRPNQVFRHGGMTTLPFGPADGPFDLGVFFSVFTHTHADETALLLADTKRLMAPTGVVVADVITSPLVERAAGHRGQMVVNRRHFERLAAAVGFPTAEVIGEWPWGPHADRRMYILK